MESRILSAYEMLNEHCGACWFANKGKNFEHAFKTCGVLADVTGWLPRDWHQKTQPIGKDNVACYSCKLPVHLCNPAKVTVRPGELKCLRSDAMSCMVLMAYKLNVECVIEMGENRSFEDFLQWMLETTSYNGWKCVRALFVFEKLISLKG
jgi:hypothetical protein